MKFSQMLFELTQPIKTNLNSIYNDLQSRIEKNSPAWLKDPENQLLDKTNFGLKGIVDTVRQETFLYKKKGINRYGITIWFYSNIDADTIERTKNLLKSAYAKKFNFNKEFIINNKLLKIIVDE